MATLITGTQIRNALLELVEAAQAGDLHDFQRAARFFQTEIEEVETAEKAGFEPTYPTFMVMTSDRHQFDIAVQTVDWAVGMRIFKETDL